jgi:hypothetical protein
VFSAIDLSVATRRCDSTCGIHQRMLPPLTVTTAIGLSIAKRRCGSTYGTLVYTNRIRRPLWMSFSALSRRLIMTLLSLQLLHMPTCRPLRSFSDYHQPRHTTTLPTDHVLTRRTERDGRCQRHTPVSTRARG